MGHSPTPSRVIRLPVLPSSHKILQNPRPHQHNVLNNDSGIIPSPKVPILCWASMSNTAGFYRSLMSCSDHSLKWIPPALNTTAKVPTIRLMMSVKLSTISCANTYYPRSDVAKGMHSSKPKYKQSKGQLARTHHLAKSDAFPPGLVNEGIWLHVRAQVVHLVEELGVPSTCERLRGPAIACRFALRSAKWTGRCCLAKRFSSLAGPCT